MFDKTKYNIKYNAENRTIIRIGVSIAEKKLFDEFTSEINVQSSAYIKALINADMAKRGYKPIFRDNRKLDSEPIFPEE